MVGYEPMPSNKERGGGGGEVNGTWNSSYPSFFWEIWVAVGGRSRWQMMSDENPNIGFHMWGMSEVVCSPKACWYALIEYLALC